jgi:DNA polymerase-3 subunit delta'
MEILLHPQARARFDSLINDTPHALLLIAADGSGKEYLLHELALKIAGSNSAGRVIEIKPEIKSKTIKVDQIRDLKVLLKTKYDKNRVVVIPKAQLLTHSAQSALLKLLEEPLEGVHLLLGLTNRSDVIETIISRCQIWLLPDPTEKQIYEYFSQNSRVDLSRIISIAGGRVGLIAAMLNDDSTNDLLQMIELSKKILQEDLFDKLARIDELSKKNHDINLLLEAITLISKAAMNGAAKANTKTLSSWHSRLTHVMEARKLLEVNVSSKLVLTQLFMKL